MSTPVAATPRLEVAFDVSPLTRPRERHVRLPGAYTDFASTPDTAALDASTQLDVIVFCALDDWDTGTAQILASKAAANQNSWAFYVDTNDTLHLLASYDGLAWGPSAGSTEKLDAEPGQPLWVRVTFRANNGAGGNDTAFYTSHNGTHWTQLGKVVTNSGTSSIFNSNAVVRLGYAANVDVPTGEFYALEMRTTIDGAAVAKVDFRKATIGATTIVDDTGKTWTLAGNATFEEGDWQQIDAQPAGFTYSPVFMEQVNSSTSIYSGASALKWDHLLGNGPNRYVIVAVQIEQAGGVTRTVSGVTFNGVAMTAVSSGAADIVEAGTQQRVELWYMLEASLPAGPGRYQIVVTLSSALAASGSCQAHSMSLVRRAQSAPEAVVTSTDATDDTTHSSSITTLTDHAVVIDAIGGGQAGELTPSVHYQTKRVETQEETLGAVLAMSTRRVIDSGAVTFGWESSVTQNRWAHVLVSIAPASATFLASSLRGVSAKRGARIRTGEIEPSETTIDVDNVNGAMSPGNPMSPWYPRVELRRRARVVMASSDGSERALCTGYLARIASSPRVKAATAKLTLDDILTLLGSKTLPASVLELVMRELGPSSYWPLGGDTAGRVCEDIVGVVDGTYLRDVTPGSTIIPLDGQASQALGPDASAGPQVITFPMRTIPDSFSFVMWRRFPGGTILNATNPSGSYCRMDFAGSSPGAIIGDVNRVEATALRRRLFAGQPGTYPFNDGGVHLLVWTFNAGADAGNALYIDREPIRELLHVTGGAGTSTSMSAALQLGDSAAALAYEYAHVAFFENQILTLADVQAIYDAGMVAWDGDLTGERLRRLFVAAGLDPADLDLDPGRAYCGPAMLNRAFLMDVVKEVVATEPGGIMFPTAEGRIAFREPVSNDPTSTVTYGDTPGTVLYESIDREPLSIDRVVNIASVTREGDGTQIITSEESVDENGPLAVSLTTVARTANGARAVGAKLVARQDEPRAIISSVRVKGALASTTMAATADVEVSDAVTIAADPSNEPAISQRSLVEQSTHEWADGLDWITDLAVIEHVELPGFKFDTPDRGFDRAAWGA